MCPCEHVCTCASVSLSVCTYVRVYVGCVCMDECMTIMPIGFMFYMFVPVCVQGSGW